MSETYTKEIEFIKTTVDGLLPVLKTMGVLNFPTADELFKLAKTKSDTEEGQLLFIKGYLKGVGLVCGNIRNVNRNKTLNLN